MKTTNYQLRDVLIHKGLSNRECEVAALVTLGLTNKEVADQLFVTEKTIKFHLTNVYRKMQVKSRAQLIVWCVPFKEAPKVETEKAPTTDADGKLKSGVVGLDLAS